MDKIMLDIYTERVLLKRTQELIRSVPFDVFVCIEQIINEAVNNHYIYRCKLEELIALLQEAESQKENDDKMADQRSSEFKSLCMTSNIQNDNTVFRNQMYDHGTVRYKRLIIMMLAGKVSADDKAKINGVTF